MRRSTTTATPTTVTAIDPSDSVAPTDPADPADTVTPDVLPAACELLLEADVVAAFGQPVTAGPQTQDDCWWGTANDLKNVNLIRRTDDLETWRSGYDNDYWRTIDLGDEAYQGTVLHSIVWRVGDVQYEVNVNFSTAGDPDQIVETLAQAAAARL